MEAVVAEGLVVVYKGGVRALDGLDLEVREGEEMMGGLIGGRWGSSSGR